MLTDEPNAWDEVSATSEVAWAAGIFEGEGCFTISGGHPRVKLNMTDEDTIRRFHDVVCVGQVRVDDAQLKHGYKRQWEWYSASREGVIATIRLLWPWLGFRRRNRALDLLARYA